MSRTILVTSRLGPLRFLRVFVTRAIYRLEEASPHLTLFPLVGDDVHRRFLGTRRCPVDAYIVTDQILFVVGPDPLIGLHESARPFTADFAIVEKVISEVVAADVRFLGV